MGIIHEYPFPLNIKQPRNHGGCRKFTDIWDHLDLGRTSLILGEWDYPKLLVEDNWGSFLEYF